MIVCKGPKSSVDLQVIQLHLSVSLHTFEDNKKKLLSCVLFVLYWF